MVMSSLYILLSSSILPASHEASRPPSSGPRDCEATVLDITATMLESRPVSPHVPLLVIHQHVDDVERSPMEGCIASPVRGGLCYTNNFEVKVDVGSVG